MAAALRRCGRDGWPGCGTYTPRAFVPARAQRAAPLPRAPVGRLHARRNHSATHSRGRLCHSWWAPFNASAGARTGRTAVRPSLVFGGREEARTRCPGLLVR